MTALEFVQRSSVINSIPHPVIARHQASNCTGAYRIAGYFRGVYISRISRKHSQSSKIKIVKKIINVDEAQFSISIREITFREQELNWLFVKYKRLENNPLYGIFE